MRCLWPDKPMPIMLMGMVRMDDPSLLWSSFSLDDDALFYSAVYFKLGPKAN